MFSEWKFTIKDIAEKPELFMSGHRACAGCAPATVLRLIMKAVRGPTIVTNATGCMEVVSSIYPYTSWATPWLHTAFENVAANASGIEAALKIMKKKGRIKQEQIDVIALAGDGGTYDIGIQALSGAVERGHDFLFVLYDNEAYMNCLSRESLIMIKDGLKKITEVKKGDEIYAFDQKSYQPVLKKCTGIFDNGTRGIYELETLHHSIKATSNHPFLVLKRNGRGRKNGFVWKTLSEVKDEDEVVVLKNLDSSESFKFNFEKIRKGDWKVNRLNEVNIPKCSSPDLMKYLGIYVGDGWVRPKKGEVGFALPDGSRSRKVLTKLHSEIFGNEIKTNDKMYVYSHSVNLARFIDSLGFGSGAKNKITPSWIFTLPNEEKEAFLQGLMLSDGYRIGNSLRYVSASRELLRRLRLLLQTMGYRVGKIHKQEKKKGTKCVGRKLLKDAEYGYICFSKRRKWNIKKYPAQYGYQNFLIGNEHFDMEKVKCTRYVGEEPTLDLRVEGEHNFIADGIVVHNTGIQRSGGTPLGASTTTSPAGTVIPGKLENKKPIADIMVAHDMPYVATASPYYWRDLLVKVRKGIEVNGPAFLHVFAPCPRGWRSDPSKSIELSGLAVETCVFPLWEAVNGEYQLSAPSKVIALAPQKKKPVKEYLQVQGRFRHLFTPKFEKMLDEIQRITDEKWQRLLKKCGVTQTP